MYEFKYFQAPKPVRRGKSAKAGRSTLSDLTSREMDLLADAGWEFIGLEMRPILMRGWFGRMRQREESFMVFRRPTDIRAHVPLLIGPRPGESVEAWREPEVKPRRVRVLNPGAGTNRPIMTRRPALPLLAS
ncbi:hypothetical protein [Albidovulum sediminis]|uniref:DUF4177 domain-containing protein n=1 Tax=Albidovulum sediminis TaxID=3066345 RepID=A0ABT2NHT2_9RHOB|nr:hypothetical protein [Defluviimonas sediminis]MCT8328478.1 hypothetical protein [Defluviimonas sediminis]